MSPAVSVERSEAESQPFRCPVRLAPCRKALPKLRSAPTAAMLGPFILTEGSKCMTSKINSASFLSVASTGALAFFLATQPSPSSAQECLLDTDDDGVVGASDTDGGATADPNDALACGENASAARR